MSDWSCSLCTYINQNCAVKCEMCQTERQFNAPKPSTDQDLELAKFLQQQYNHEVNYPWTNPKHKKRSSANIHEISDFDLEITSNHNHDSSANSNSNSNIHSRSVSSNSWHRSISINRDTPSTSSVNSTQSRNNHLKRKRKRSEIEPNEETDINIPNKCQIREQLFDDNRSENDIIKRIGVDFVPGTFNRYTNVVSSGKVQLMVSKQDNRASQHKPIDSILRRDSWFGSGTGIVIVGVNGNDPWLIIDCKDIKIAPTMFVVHKAYYVLDDLGRERFNDEAHDGKFIFEGSNDFKRWDVIPTKDDNSKFRVDLQGNIEGRAYYTKFRIRFTDYFYSKMRIVQLFIFGNTRRKVYNIKRIGEVKDFIPFPKITGNKCIGDPNNILKIINSELQKDDEYKEYNEPIPNLKIELKDYQKKGVSWMIDMEENGNDNGIHGGLLADEMGLGKTVQIIALMLIQKKKKENNKDRTIIITPLSLIDQWIAEFDKITNKNTFKIINWYGKERKKITKSDFDNCDVVLSTTQTFTNAMGKTQRLWDDFNAEWWTQTKNPSLLFKLRNGFFNRIVIDESHEIRNTISSKSNAICTFANRCNNRWCLTGTPINNDLPSDLSGMCRYLGISHQEYVDGLKLSETEKYAEERVLPPKEMKAHIWKQKKKGLWLDFDNEYCVNKMRDFLKPIMLRRTKKQVLNDNFVEKEEIVIKCALNDEERIIYDKNVNQAKLQYKQFKQNKSVMAHYMHLVRMLTKLRQICDHPFIVFNKILLNNNDDNDCENKNVMNIDVLRNMESTILNRLNEMDSMINYECPICYELTELNGAILSKCGHLFCIECINELEKQCCAICRTRFTQTNILRINTVFQSTKLDEKHKADFEQFKGGNNNNNKCYDKYNQYIDKYCNELSVSSKIKLLIQRLNYISQHHCGDKVLVFSNFTQFFNIIGKHLSKEKIEYLQFDGTLNRKKRKNVLDSFKSSPTCSVLLISAKCASVGLNLMCANHVIFLDPRCNPGLDNQAIGRCWRIGQKKKVFVTRLIIKDSIEEKILKLQQYKDKNQESELVNLKQKAKLNENDYDALFGIENNH